MFLSKGVRVTGLLIGLAAVAVVGETVGNTQTGTSYSAANDRCAVRVVMPEEGDITSISVYCKDPDNELGEPYIYAVYSDASNAPATRLEKSARLNLTAGTGWKSADLTSSLHVQANTVLWLALIYGDSPGVYYSSSTGGTVARSGVNWVSGTDEQNMPSSYGSVSSTETRQYCVYATYTPSTGGGSGGWTSASGVTSTTDQVGIGAGMTTIPGGSTTMLAVNGTIRAKEVIVTAAGWPDFVFTPGYALKPLSDVEDYIRENSRLEGIPSENEVMEKGVPMGEMQAKLLQKLEETTLYLIEMKKENEQLKARLSAIEQKVR
jgi:hypothetical protein